MKIGKLLYFYDALCGWCYGFSDVMLAIKDKYEGNFDFEIVSGGMVTGERVGKIAERFNYIQKAYKEVEDSTGCKFGSDFLNEILESKEFIMSSVEPSRALTAFKELKEEGSFEYAHSLQNALYFDALDIKDESVLADLSEKNNASKEHFLELYRSKLQRKRKKSSNLLLRWGFKASQR